VLLDWLSSNGWVVWLIVAGGLAVSEMLTLDLTLLMLSSGALAGAVVAFFLPGFVWAQLLVAAVVALTMLFVTRPVLLKRLRNSPGYRSSTSKILGSSGTATDEITPTGGEVKIAGELWSARSYDASVIAVGTEVEVLEMDGITAVVYPKHRPLVA
jgi:membrane protein implicated in regulation of membrane protease activity